MIPVLFITFNRLEYTKKALEALFLSRGRKIFIIDNGSTDGTVEWLQSQPWNATWKMTFNKTNLGIAGAMNQFLAMTKKFEWVGKVDNDTLVPPDWAITLRDKCVQCKIDILQAKHPIIPAVANGKSFDQWVSDMKPDFRDSSIRYHHFVGGSGIIFRRSSITEIPVTEWKLYGWRQFQRDNPKLKKAFCTDVEVELLDGAGDYSDYPEYYKSTGRLK
jgi:glycosyltransferase involved in cell wall biosynthesis